MQLTEAIRRHISLLSDTLLFSEAEKFVQTFLHENDPISAAQLNGLENLFSVTERMSDINDYIRHQHDKASGNADPNRRNKDFYVARFYEALEKKLKELETYIKEHSDDFPVPDDASKKIQREYVRMYQFYVTKEFIQHLVADHQFRARQG